MRFALNIGLLTSSNFGPVTDVSHGRIVAALNTHSFHTRQSSVMNRILAEGTGIFLVADDNPLSLYSVKDRFEMVAEDLQQDCIAVVPLEHHVRLNDRAYSWEPMWQRARLIGPYHQLWGAFDRAQFTLPQL